jgi:uncharacterized OsmC-like protein
MIAKPSMNGVDTGKLMETIEAVRGNPDLARSEFRAQNRWSDGGFNTARITDFHAAGEETSHAQPFELAADEPPVLLGKDRGANPVEHLLAALSSCMTTSMVYHAAANGIKIEELESDFSGELDLQGFLGLRSDVRPGYQSIRATFRVRSDAEPEQLAEYVKYSPVYDVVSKSVPISVNVERK